MLVRHYSPDRIGTGMLPTSEVFFHTATKFAREALYYLICMGDYQVDSRYIVARIAPEKRVQYFQLFLITSGALHFSYQNRLFTAPKGSIVLIDCREPHDYRAQGPASFKWFAYDGPTAKAYCDWLLSFGSPLFFPKDFASLNAQMLSLLQMFASRRINEQKVSIQLQSVLCSLGSVSCDPADSTDQTINEAALYMEEHFMEPLRVETLAAGNNLSVPYFIRQFRKVHGSTPHEYLTNVRLTHAKRLLLTTKLSVIEISAAVGFKSSTNFIRFFKSETGLTPLQFCAYEPFYGL
ncbi:AraC family transcriptional regulator [Butyricicoccus sp. Marseille-Q5471]|uniref:AraC family transcriptional regulator n=1 Tax=Butyricicoccus sp. Marseille-Q5471 TaxID=3039493 RepID=UPI0024BC823B|nr:AraC family transcriptional regulator [Butyricicoccus sp. Marseille-Q5471]